MYGLAGYLGWGAEKFNNKPVIFENSSIISSFDLLLGILPTKRRRLATDTFTLIFLLGLISKPSSCE